MNSATTACHAWCIEDFAITQGRLEWDDRQVDVHAVLTPVDLHFDRLSTLPNERDTWQFAADVAGGGRMRWRGEASLSPIRAAGEIVLEELPLPMLAAYLKPYAHAVVASGRLSATLPYEFAYDAGRLDARLRGARLAVADLAASHGQPQQRFAALRQLEVGQVDANLAGREAVIGSVRLAGGELALQRDAHGRWDLADLLVERPAAAAPRSPRHGRSACGSCRPRHSRCASSMRRCSPRSPSPSAASAARSRCEAAQTSQALALKASQGALVAERLALAQSGRPPLTLERVRVERAGVDLAARHVEAGRIALEGGQLRVVRDARGRIDLMALVPTAAGAPSTSAPGPAWTARAAQVALSRVTLDVEDQGIGLRTQLQDVALRLDGVGTDLRQPVPFEAALRVREGGELAMHGRLVPATRSLDAQVQVRQLALPAAQPVLARYVRLKLASGTLSTQGRLEAGLADGKPPTVRYTGRAELANLRLDELDGQLFARWKQVSAEKLALGTRGLQVPELRVLAPEATLIIENDRSFNAARLLVRRPGQGAAPPRPAGAPGQEPFPVRIDRLRLQDARLAFTDLSLRPQFSAAHLRAQRRGDRPVLAPRRRAARSSWTGAWTSTAWRACAARSTRSRRWPTPT